jgi:hypothetical protein
VEEIRDGPQSYYARSEHAKCIVANIVTVLLAVFLILNPSFSSAGNKIIHGYRLLYEKDTIFLYY